MLEIKHAKKSYIETVHDGAKQNDNNVGFPEASYV